MSNIKNIMVAHVFIDGFVQGVGYRAFVKNNARKLNLRGWVKNTNDGRVEAVIQGQKEDIEKLIMTCEKGPFLSEVKSVQVEWEDKAWDFKGFDILH
jgi:acylphosphatase